MLPLLILVPLAGLLALNLPVGEAVRKCGLGLALLLTAAQAGVAIFAPPELWTSTGPLDRFLTFTLAADNLSRVLLLSVGIVVFSTLLVGRSMIADAPRRGNLVNVVLLAMVGMNGTVLLTDLFSLYVFLEITSVCSFILIAFDRAKHALEGAFKYIILSAVATILMLGSVGLLLMVAGGTSFAAVSAALKAAGGVSVARIAVGAFVCGLFIKGGLVPFHGWLPAAYSSAPAAVSVLLAGIATKVSGIYALIRLVTAVFPAGAALNGALMAVGAVSIIVGALAALNQRDMKRLLAYSSISQVGYIILGLGCGTELAIAGAIFHLFNHAIFKSLLFVNSAAIEQRLGTTDMTGMGGLGTRMPVTGVTNVVAVLSTAGVPPLAGFWSKLIIIVALWQARHYAYAAIAVLFSVVTLGYLLLMQRKVFFGKTAEGLGELREAGLGVVVPELLLAVITVAVGLLLPFVLNTFLLPVRGIL